MSTFRKMAEVYDFLGKNHKRHNGPEGRLFFPPQITAETETRFVQINLNLSPSFTQKTLQVFFQTLHSLQTLDI